MVRIPDTSHEPWTARDAELLYLMAAWSDGFFGVGENGNVHVIPDPSTASATIDIRQVVDRLVERGVKFPLLIRFQDVLKGRVVRLNQAFDEAIREQEYDNRYVGVYPIKVNQLHEVVEEVLDAGRPFNMGLECGSKTELIAALALLESDDTLLICNGYKDPNMLDLILTGQQIGKNVIPVIEKYDELESLMAQASRRKLETRFGIRVRLTTAGAGKWADSGGDLSKFGISIPELLRVMERLQEADATDAFQLLHFHLGSQISDIRTLKKAVKEITQVYVQMLRRGFHVQYLDVGGGLGVNYGASYLGHDDGINYSLQEYANAIVQSVKEVCENEEVPHPTLVSESGRAITAHHSVLIVDAIGTYRKDEIDPDFEPVDDDHQVVHDLFTTWKWIREEDTMSIHQLLEAFHDAAGKRQEADSMFAFGLLPIEQKSLAERLYWTICRIINSFVHAAADEVVPPELDALDAHLVDQCLCDFSVFQSVLDHWAIGQRFPILPLQRLDEEPDRRSVLVDLTCDSDGKVSTYISGDRSEKRFLEMHPLRQGEPYYFGFFLMGAYQDIMGDTHNLFGRVTEAHIYADEEEEDGFYVEKIIPGTSVEDMLALVQYFPQDLISRMNKQIRSKVDEGVLRPKSGIDLLDTYTKAFSDNTYYRSNGVHDE